ncbi:MAG: hypothetical protein JSV35_07910 [Candidatus Bathyarchaeota archaeon]|nr:MAG: hypothetical protein JSV35_07910 [Candidatus Bathyarchaeota archaeon]
MQKGAVLTVMILLLSGANLTQTSASHQTASPLEVKDWTIIVYLDGDCDLESLQIEAFLLMASVGSTADINILVQFDRIDGYDSRYGDWKGCKRFYVTSGMTPEGYNALSHLGEPNMGDPLTLKNFVVWAVNQYPAEKYALILSDHGDNGGVCEDLTGNYDYLSCAEIYETLQAITETVGVTIDLIIYEACVMAAIEVVYHSAIGAEAIVASEELGAAYFPYEEVLSELASFPTMNSTTLAQNFVYYYILFWSNSQPPDDVVTLSAFNLTYLSSNLIPAVNTLANNLSQALTWHIYDILAAIDATEYTIPPIAHGLYIADLYHFAENIQEHVRDLQVQSAAQSVMDAIVAGRFAEGHGPAHTNFHGLSIYLPPTIEAYDARTPLYSSDNLHWVMNNAWDNFLRALFVTCALGFSSQESLDAVSFMPFDSNADDYFDAVHIIVDADTTAESIGVSVHGRLIDPSNNTVDNAIINWTISGNEDEWCDLYLSMPAGGEEGLYDVELQLFDEYGILEDYYYRYDAAYFPEEMHHDVAVSNISVTRTAVGQGFPAQINITLENKGDYTETFTVTTHANETLVNSTQLMLSSNILTALTVYWNTTGQVMGNYTITVEVEPVNGEINTTDNSLAADSELCITIPGDVDADHDVDIFDILRIADSYGTHKGDTEFWGNCDIDDDGDVDIFDVTTAVAYYGDNW